MPGAGSSDSSCDCRCVITSASWATVGASKKDLRGTVVCKVVWRRTMICMASREWPPNVKKLAWMPTCSISSTCDQVAAIVSSSGVRAFMKVDSSSGWAWSGTGRARRSTLPLAFKGIASNNTKRVGIIYSGSLSLSQVRNSSLVGAWSFEGTIYATRYLLPAAVSLARTIVSRIAGWRSKTASISPGSMRTPRILIRLSLRPRNSTRPSGR